ncbi:hypothetical protein N7462_008218 [Penicillium macrosclerotiorum]|uniref:uncharacterized protein n=1 Tax=Penicillium macrosclerotiorum TaxID=303699 RepID=UPI0025479AD5|nr:uncharacterized protein N7462_008218 [Penicillium macrosclerotiorum]KAJ5679974.1 hypothetical protein N7462_008218 [Penicillium macrosclerotiorum]
MNDSPPFTIPDRVSSLMSTERHDKIKQYKMRSVSVASRVSEISQTADDSTVPKFISAKIDELANETEWLCEVTDSCADARAAGSISQAEYDAKVDPLLTKFRSMTSILASLRRQRRVLSEDLKDAVETQKRRRHEGPPDAGLLERAYAEAIVTQIMKADGNLPASPFNKREFKRAVNDYYGVAEYSDQTWCHVLGRHLERKSVKAAHIVPKSMDLSQLAHLFGDQDAVTTLPQNGLSLHHKVENLLDKGDIVIVPMPGNLTSPTSWKCLVINETIKEHTVYTSDRQKGEERKIIRVKDLDGRQLDFLSDNRPRRRYLYLQFIVSYLWAKKRELPNIAEKVETRKFWPSGGDYLRKSTLQTMARCISGCEIPDNLLSGQTFEESIASSQDVQAGMLLAADVKCLPIRDSSRPDLMGALSTAIMKNG